MFGFAARLWLHTSFPRFAAPLYGYIHTFVYYMEFQEVFCVLGQARWKLDFFGALMLFICSV